MEGCREAGIQCDSDSAGRATDGPGHAIPPSLLRRRLVAVLLLDDVDLRAGRAREACLLIPERFEVVGGAEQQATASHVWAEALLAVGETTAAYDWMVLLQTTVERHQLPKFQTRLNALAQRL